jgi:hypothetical protein
MNVSRVLEGILDKGSEAVFDIGRYRITIAPKAPPRLPLKTSEQEDARLWRKIEPTLRSVRSDRTKKKYPWLYE